MSVLRKGWAPLGPKVGVTSDPFLLAFLLLPPPPQAGVGFAFVCQAAQTPPLPSSPSPKAVVGSTGTGDVAFAWR